MPYRTAGRAFVCAVLLVASCPGSGSAARIQASDTDAPTGAVSTALRILRKPKARSHHRRAFRALQQAERDGSVKASVALAKIAGRGLFGHPKDQAAARLHLERAADAGSQAAAKWLVNNPEEEGLVIDAGVGTPAPPPVAAPVVPAQDKGPSRGPPTETLRHVREVLVFRQDRCPPCERFDPVVAAVFRTPRAVTLRVLDLASDEGMLLASKYGIRGTPTTVLTNKDGDPLIQIVGPVPRDDFEDIVSRSGEAN